MSYLKGILLLVGVLALGNAAPVSTTARRVIYYQQALNNLKALARQESVPPGDLFRIAGDIIGKLNGPEAKKQWSVSVGYPLAQAESSTDYGDAARALGDLINALGGRQEIAEQEDLANQQRSWHTEDYMNALGLAGSLLG